MAQERYEHYRSLAENTRDDRVTRENYWQHAEHFLRVLTERDASLRPSANSGKPMHSLATSTK